MHCITPPDSVIQAAIGSQQTTDCAYRWSKYVIRKEVADGLLCYNTLTCELLHIPSAKYADCSCDPALIGKWFLVPQDFDEYRLAQQAKKLRQMVYRAGSNKKWEQSIDKYWILTTTNCNARCYYCHEKGIPQMHMRKKTAEQVVRYIEKHCKNKLAHIMWYGGEPLINESVIDLITQGLKDKGIRPSGSMISNGYAFNRAMAEKACSLWNLNEVQITLDGKEDTYNRVKAYCCPGKDSPFLRVLDNIDLLLENGIKVHVRLNIDTYNQEELFELAEQLICRFSLSPYFFVYSAPLLEECLGTNYKRQQSQRKSVYEAHFRLSELLNDAGILLKTQLPKAMRSEMRCIAVSDMRVIFPDGQLAFCHDYSDGILSGDIWGNEPTVEERLQYTVCLPQTEECKDCVKYPQCVRFLKCFKNQCNEDLVQDWIRCTEREMVWEYERILKKENTLQENGGCFLEIH